MTSQPTRPQRFAPHAMRRLIEPPADITNPAQRIKARGVLTLALFLVAITVLQIAILHLERSRGALLLPTLIGIILAYLLVRTNRLRAGIYLLIATLWLTGPFLVIALENHFTVLQLVQAVEYPLLALLTAQSLVSRRAFYLLILATALYLLIPPYNGNLVYSVMFSTALIFVVGSLALTFAILNGADQEVRALTEQERQREEARYRIVTEMVSDFVFKLRVGRDGDMQTEWTAGSMSKVLGSAGMLAEESPVWLLTLAVSEDLPAMSRAFALLPSGERTEVEARFRLSDGSIRWLRLYARGEVDPATGELRAIYGAAQDITWRKQVEQELRESEKRLRAITDSNVMGILMVRERGGDILYANQVAAQLLGYPSPDNLIGMVRVGQLLTREDGRRMKDMLRDTDHMEDVEIQPVRPDGARIWMSISTSRTTLDGEPMLLSSFSDISSRKAAELALLEQREQYEALVNSLDGVVWTVDAVSRETIFVSRQIEALSGYKQARFTEDPRLWLTLIHPDDVEQAVRTRTEAVQERRPFQQDYRMIGASGQIIWLRDVVTIESGPSGRLLMRGLSINITGSKTAQLAEEEQRRLNDALRETAATISSTLDLNEVLDRILERLNVVVPSDAADIMLIEGQQAHIVRTRGYQGRDLSGPDDVAGFPIHDMPTFGTMLESGQPLIVNDTWNDPTWRHFEVTNWARSWLGAPIWLEGRTIGFVNLTSTRVGVFHESQAEVLQAFADQTAIAIRNARLYEQVSRYADVLESQVQQRTIELELERQRISAMLDSTGDGIFYTEDDVIRYANHALSGMSGYSAEELLGRSIPSLGARSGPDPEAAGQWLHDMMIQLDAFGIWRGEAEIQRKDGTTFYAGLTTSRIGPPGVHPLRCVTVLRDISKEKALQVQQSNLVAYASHELRTPITNLKTRLYLLRRRPEQLETHLNVLDQVTERMKRLVEDLLDISRMERGVIPLKRETMAIDILIRHIMEVQQPEADRKGLTLIVDLPDAPLYVYADQERLSQVITNLVTNAVNYTRPGGTIRVLLVDNDPDDTLSILVQDTGIGIRPEHLAHIFQPFFRVVSHVEGTGLGLSIARQIVDMHGGELSVESVVGEGSTFTVTLQRVPPPPQPVLTASSLGTTS